MKKYEAYKKSGVLGVDVVPENWKVINFRYLIDILTDFTSNGSFGDLAKNVNYLEEGISRLVRLTDLRANFQNKGIYLNEASHNYLKKSELFGGEILLANVGAYAGLAWVFEDFEGKASLGPNMFLLKFKEVLNKRFAYISLTSFYLHSQLLDKSTSSAQPKLNKEDIKSCIFILPSVAEQTQITNYLDYKTTIIDALIDKKEQLIKKLQAQRQAIINEAVTKGLDKKAKMKNSGIDWLGEIPDHWEVVKLSYLIEVIGGSTPRTNVDEYWDGNIEWVTTDDLGKLKTKNIIYARRKITELGLQNCSARVIPKGSVIISCRAPIGYLGILNINASFNQGCKGLIPFNDNIISDYLYYYLLSSKKELESLGTGSTFMEISTSNLKNFKILLPTKNEQKEIVDYLEEKTIKMDLLLEKVKNQIKKLKSYRQSIISEAVTGKIDVRDWQPKKNI
jgi:type I restriction enzyme S subunit